MKEREALAEQLAKPKEKAEYAKGFVDGFDECVKQTQPPQRAWVGLTTDEMSEIITKLRDAPVALAFAIEAKLKEKNENSSSP